MNQTQIRELKDARSIAYILQEPNKYLPTAYKVLQAQSGFLPCTHVLHNGKDKLFYITDGYKDLKGLLPGLKPQQFLKMMAQCFHILESIQANGFLQCENVQTDFAQVFVDPTDESVRLLYLPVEPGYGAAAGAFGEQKLRAQIPMAVEDFDNLKSERTKQVAACVADPLSALETIRTLLKAEEGEAIGVTEAIAQPEIAGAPSKQLPSGRLPEMPPQQQEKQKTNQPQEQKKRFPFSRKAKETPARTPARPMPTGEISGGATEVLDEIFEPTILLQGVNTPEDIEILITKDHFLLGKKSDQVDGLVSFNNAISRVHCRILYRNGVHYLADAGSANGTFLNGGKLEPEYEAAIKPGDKIKLANTTFIVKKA